MATVKILRFHPEKCDGALECEAACSNVHFKHDKGGEWSAIRILKKEAALPPAGTPSEAGYEMDVCNQCGLCIDMCPTQAIKRLANGTVVVDKKACVGCQSCVGFCPGGVMRKAPEVIVPFKCISCGACVKACPTGALELVEVELADVEEEVYHKHGRVCL